MKICTGKTYHGDISEAGSVLNGMETDLSEGLPVKVNQRLDRWVRRLAAHSYQALLLLIDGKLTQKQIAAQTGVAQPNVSRLRTKYESLSGKSIVRSSSLIAA